jgi:hypothetical protein
LTVVSQTRPTARGAGGAARSGGDGRRRPPPSEGSKLKSSAPIRRWQTVTLKFTGTENSSLQTLFVVDDTAVNAN